MKNEATLRDIPEVQRYVEDGPMTNRREKLPKWAQEEIVRLEGQIVRLQDKLSVGPENSNTFVDGFGINPDRPLGDHAKIRFHLTDDTIIDAYVEGRKLVVRSRSGDVISVVPSASNSILIGRGEYQ